jgi:hypothetical protein
VENLFIANNVQCLRQQPRWFASILQRRRRTRQRRFIQRQGVLKVGILIADRRDTNREEAKDAKRSGFSRGETHFLLFACFVPSRLRYNNR